MAVHVLRRLTRCKLRNLAWSLLTLRLLNLLVLKRDPLQGPIPIYVRILKLSLQLHLDLNRNRLHSSITHGKISKGEGLEPLLQVLEHSGHHAKASI